MSPLLVLIAIGVIGGGVGFAGFFVDFFNQGGTDLATASSGWFDLVPIFIGLSVLALLLPRYGLLFSGLPLISMGIAFGLRGTASGLGKSGAAASQIDYGPGFWMVVIGSAVLVIAWLAIIFTETEWVDAI